MTDSIINRFVNNLPFEMHLWDPIIGKYSAAGPGTKHKERLDKYMRTGDTRHIFMNELDKACFYHDAAYSKHRDVGNRQIADRKLMDACREIANDTKIDGYQRSLATAIHKFFEKKIQMGQGLKRADRVMLKKIYYDPAQGFSSIAELSRRTGIKPADALDWLQEQETYTKHKPHKGKHQTRRVMVRGIDAQWQGDLVDMRSMAGINKNTNYILTVVDCFSKYAWAAPIKKKTGSEITKAFMKIFKERQPEKLQTDKGTEFINKEAQQLFQNRSVQWFATENETKAQIVERFNRTLKDRMYRYFTANKTKQWIDVLPKLIENYNTSHHRTIKMTPTEASKKVNESAVWNNLYGDAQPTVQPKLEVGDVVRIFKLRGKFKRGYTPNYTSELFKVAEVLSTSPPTYKINDLMGEEVIGSFYKEELSKFNLA